MPKKINPAAAENENYSFDPAEFEAAMPAPVEEVPEYDPEYWEERVEWFVPLDPTQPHDRTLLMQINGHYFKMMRGTKVKVPRYVIESYNEQQAELVALVMKQEELENMKNLTEM